MKDVHMRLGLRRILRELNRALRTSSHAALIDRLKIDLFTAREGEELGAHGQDGEQGKSLHRGSRLRRLCGGLASYIDDCLSNHNTHSSSKQRNHSRHFTLRQEP